MKLHTCIISGLMLILLTACSLQSPQSNTSDPLILTLEIAQEEVHSVDDLKVEIALSNQGEAAVLVHKRLYWFPYSAPSKGVEMLILLFDSSGNPIVNESFNPHGYLPPSIDTLDALGPGKQVIREIYIPREYYASLIKPVEKYKLIAIYQNEYELTNTINGVEVPAWVGSIRSNEVTFTILP
ncbi:MAG: hypothetical protein HY865_22940 [Chloroflexi bacterium]|nr:hypothetical protein [Chloroflexota bacterium]